MLDGKGMQLLITGTSKLERVNKSWTRSFLADMVESIGMTTIFGPQIDVLAAHKVTGFVVLAESHASIHWTRPLFWLDLFSCRTFQVNEVVLWVAQEWQIVEGYYQVLERGWNPKLNAEVQTYPMPVLPRAFEKIS